MIKFLLLILLIPNILFAQADVAPDILIKDEGVNQGFVQTIDCVGSGVSCTTSAGSATFNISGGAGSTPGGGQNAVQYNNASAFAGDETVFSFNGTNVGVGTSNGTSLLDVNGIAQADVFKVTMFSSSPALYADADTNTGLVFEAPDVITLDTGGAHAMTIGASQNIGIGTLSPATAPQAQLHVVNSRAIDSFRVDDADGGDASPFVINSNGNVGIGTWAPLGLFQVNSATNSPFIVNNAGNLGIGTVDPTSMLQVFKATNPAILSLTSNPASTTTINLGDTTQPTMGQVAYANASDSMYFVVNGAERMRVSSSGNIGVGTTTPLGGLVVMNGNVGIGTNSLIRGKLHIYDSLHSWYQNLASWGYKYSNESNDRINISSTGSDPRHAYIGFATGNASLTQSGVVFAKRNAVGSVGVASIQTSDGSSLVERIVIDGAGNVGIATFSPTSLFEITSTVSRVLFRVNDDGFADATPAILVDSTGNVGIGTIDPLARLEIIGSSTNSLRIRNSGTSGASAGAGIFAQSDDGAALSDGDRLGFYLFGGSTAAGGTVQNGAGITAFAEENWTGSSIASNLRFETAPTGSTNRTEHMRITSTGNVGVGTTLPLGKFEILQTAAADAFRVLDESNDTTSFIINSDGNIGIGTTVASYGKVTVDGGAGNAQMRLDGATGGCLMMRDTDDGGWTECYTLDGVFYCSIDNDGVCDGS